MRSSIKKQSVEIKQNTTCRYASPIPAICKQSCTRGPQFNIPFRLSFIQSDYRSFQPHRIPVIPFKRNIRNVMSGPRERERERERETERQRERERGGERKRKRETAAFNNKPRRSFGCTHRTPSRRHRRRRRRCRRVILYRGVATPARVLATISWLEPHRRGARRPN